MGLLIFDPRHNLFWQSYTGKLAAEAVTAAREADEVLAPLTGKVAEAEAAGDYVALLGYKAAQENAVTEGLTNVGKAVGYWVRSWTRHEAAVGCKPVPECAW